VLFLHDEKIDLMPTYPSESMILYRCESKFTLLAIDFNYRICINGSWIGTLGKCYLPIGGTDIAKVSAINVYKDTEDENERVFVGNHYPTAGTQSEYWNFIETGI
jgi:hypothetical protein